MRSPRGQSSAALLSGGGEVSLKYCREEEASKGNVDLGESNQTPIFHGKPKKGP